MHANSLSLLHSKFIPGAPWRKAGLLVLRELTRDLYKQELQLLVLSKLTRGLKAGAEVAVCSALSSLLSSTWAELPASVLPPLDAEPA